MAAGQPLVGPARGLGPAGQPPWPLSLSPFPNGPSPSENWPIKPFDLLIDFLFIK